jgi:hypothetical protein
MIMSFELVMLKLIHVLLLIGRDGKEMFTRKAYLEDYGASH